MAVTALDERTALVLIDLQAGTLTRSGSAQPHTGPAVLANAVELADAFRAAGAPVVLVQAAVAPDGADAVPGRNDRARDAGDRARPRDLGPIVEELAGRALCGTSPNCPKPTCTSTSRAPSPRRPSASSPTECRYLLFG